MGSYHDIVDSRRSSIGKPISPKSRQNVLPHYLRASTGSCHDFCKYGRKHAFEGKERRPILKRIIPPASDKKKPVVPTEIKQNPVGTVVPAGRNENRVGAEKKKATVPTEKKKTTVVKVKPSPVFRTHLPYPPEIIKLEVLLPSKIVEVSPIQDYSNEKKTPGNGKKIGLTTKRAPAMKPKPLTAKPSPSYETSVGLNVSKEGDIKLGKETVTSKIAGKKSFASPTSILYNKPSVGRVVSINSRKYRSLKLVSPLKDQNRTGKTKAKQSNNDEVQEKTLHVVKTETENHVLESIHNNGGIIELPPSPKLSSPKSSSHSNSPSHEVEDLESEYTDSEEDTINSENDDIAKIDKIENSERNQNWRVGKRGTVLPEDKDYAQTKLKFRRGKVIDLQSENNGPRRLRFRRGRVLGENQDGKGDGRRRNFRNKGVDDDTKSHKPSSEKVVLRHQDVQGKKDDQGLFNNVIEETAIKLVESRKSKVKALVGAFETVISLQESKPSTQIVT